MEHLKRAWRALNPIDISAHDSYQVEIKALHRVPEGIPLGVEVTYVQDMFFYMPKSLGLHTEAYSKEEFYRSVTSYIRVKTPQVLADDEVQSCRVDRILPLLHHASQSATELPPSQEECIDEVRLFGAFVNDQLKLMHRELDAKVWKTDMAEVCLLVGAYRQVMDVITERLERAGSGWWGLRDAFRYVDEYLSNRIEDAVLEAQKRKVDLSNFMKDEFLRRGHKGYLQVVHPVSGAVAEEKERELFVFRMGRFKKYVSELLYLEVKRVRHDAVITNITAAIGAAMAAFVTALLDPNQRTSMSGHFFESIRDSFSLMVIVVAGVYVFKDRMKDWVKTYLLVYFRPWVPDYSYKIRSRKGRVIGQCREEVRFTNSGEVSGDIAMRRRDASNSEVILNSDSFEDVLYYRRALKIMPQELEGLFRNTKSLRDITRVDLNPFLGKLSNPRKKEEFLAPDATVKEVDLPKVYHVNLIIRHRIHSKESGDLSCTYTRARVVLDKDGIKRVEEITAEQMRSGDPRERAAA